MKTVVLPERLVYAGSLILVNAAHPVRADAEEHVLTPVCTTQNNMLLGRRAIPLFAALMDEIGGWEKIRAVSAFWSRREQAEIYQDSLAEYGRAFTERFVAQPGCSEHETGLAIDLGLGGPTLDFIRPDFPYEGICQTFRAHAPSHGFVERYPAGKEAVTGIAHESWHFRYVSIPHAALMTEKGMCLEEYHAYLKAFPFGRACVPCCAGGRTICVAYLPASKGTDTAFEIGENVPYAVSGNNEDGFVITQWGHENDF
jgi:D-alanyl-D-alanine dipeptidase/carboxypeptidase